MPKEASGPETSLLTTPAWDSLAHIRLVLAVEAHVGRQLTPDEIVSIVSLSDVHVLLTGAP
ncbi:MAG: acyl carrier protein [Pseudomonadota bacterium]